MKKLHWLIRYCLLGIVCTCVSVSELAAAQYPSSEEKVSFETQDGLTIVAWYQRPVQTTKNTPAIILIHQGGSSKKEWLALPLWNLLLAQGYALLAYDVRLHGESATDGGGLMALFNDPNRAPLDLKAAIQFLQSDEQIDNQRIGVIGASIGSNLACVAASANAYGIKSVVSMSPKTSAAQNLSGQQDKIAPNNIFLIASEKEQGGRRKQWAEELFAQATGQKRVVIGSGNKHGSYILLDNPELNQQIVEWFQLTLK